MRLPVVARVSPRKRPLVVYEVPAGWVRHVSDQLGSNHRYCRRRCGGPACRRLLTDDSERVRCPAYVDFLDRRRDFPATTCSEFRQGLRYDLRASGLAGYVSIAAATMREAMHNATRYGNLRRHQRRLRARGEGDSRQLSHREPKRSHARQLARDRVQSRDGGRRLPALGRRGVPASRSAVRACAGGVAARRRTAAQLSCAVRYGSDGSRYRTSGAARPTVARADPYLLALVTHHAEAALAASPTGRRMISAHGSSAWWSRHGRGSADTRRGRRGARTRRADAGAKARHRGRAVPADGGRPAARHGQGYLADPELSLAQIAYLLGYAEQAPSHSAFRRWTGHPPRRFRKVSPTACWTVAYPNFPARGRERIGALHRTGRSILGCMIRTCSRRRWGAIHGRWRARWCQNVLEWPKSEVHVLHEFGRLKILLRDGPAAWPHDADLPERLRPGRADRSAVLEGEALDDFRIVSGWPLRGAALDTPAVEPDDPPPLDCALVPEFDETGRNCAGARCAAVDRRIGVASFFVSGPGSLAFDEDDVMSLQADIRANEPAESLCAAA